MSKGYFVTATGTDVGKTFVTALLVKKWRDSGIDAGYYKAALSGAELRDGKWVAGDADYVKRIAAKYEIQLSWESGNKMTRGNIQKALTNFQYAIDREDNDIQQDIVTLQSYITKRDNAYSNASKLVKKANHAATATINSIE